MKKTLYLTCGKPFATKEEALVHIFRTYTTAMIRDGFGQIRDANWTDGLRRIASGEYRALSFAGKAPSFFSLRDMMPPVYDQASRGTCAANAATALMEYYEGRKTRLSVQYLYERMKREERDAYRSAAEELMSGGGVSDPEIAELASDIASSLKERSAGASVTRETVAAMLYNKRVEMDGGSSAKYVFSVLDNWGICSYEAWPYAREQLDSLDIVTDSNNRYMPPDADADAKRHRLNDRYYIFPSPNNVEEIRNYLSGSRSWKPMPIYLGVRLFADEKGVLPLDGGIARLPKLTKIPIQTATFDLPTPLCGDLDKGVIDPDTVKDVESIDVLDMHGGGGHAMLIVGYEDDASIPGGGAFIVRNSWGGEWGDGGYGRLPYAYVELFATSAATILVPKDDDDKTPYYTERPHDPMDEVRPYLQTAAQDMKDRSGKWRISKGERVIIDDDGIAEPDTPANRRLFISLGMKWTPQTSAAPVCGAGEASSRIAASGRIYSGIEASFSSISREPVAFPLLGGVTKGGLFRSRSKADCFAKTADLTPDFGAPLAIYEATGGNFRFRIAVASLPSSANVAIKADELRQVVGNYAKAHRFEVAQCTVLVLETSAGGATGVAPFVSDSEALVVLDGWTPDCGWRVCAASCGDDGAWAEWLRRLAPNTPAQWAQRLRRAWDEIAAWGGHVTLDKMASALSIGSVEVAAFVAAFLPGFNVVGGKIVKS